MGKIEEEINDTLPFISGIQHGKTEYIGIILNQDNAVTSIYDLSLCNNDADKKAFLQCGETWWWESNRKIPINIFLISEMWRFKNWIRTFNTKDVELLFGPVVRLNDIAQKRVKRKSIQLVRKLK
jgi:hypothetical protein